jgi:predicted transcriptional regulator
MNNYIKKYKKMDNDVLNILINRAKELGYTSKRKGVGINISALAREAEMRQPTLRRIFRGESEPTFSQIQKLLAALKIPCLEIYKDPRNFTIISQLDALSNSDKETLIKIIRGLKYSDHEAVNNLNVAS